ncbi:MAG: hypothetical protein DYG89_37830 [Caldilinea sp. CFX5]|nr:hypothetical protein [Caldilinea sp. CFX5]
MKGAYPFRLFLTALLSAALLVTPTTVTLAQPAAKYAAPTRALTAQEVATYFDTTLTQQMAAEHIVGATVAVVKDGELIFAKGYGYADLENRLPVVAEQTLFYPGSAGKLFTWTAVMQLVEQGKLDLHTDINHYLDFTIPATLRQTQGSAFPQPITLEHLLTHTSGFEEQLAALQVAEQADRQSLGAFLKTALPARVYPPGTTFAYSNYATVLAGYIVERVAGMPFEQYITDHLLTPLGMTHSSAYQPLPAELMANLSKGYHYHNGQYASVDFEWIAGAPAAPIRTTATDMAKFMIAHLNHGRVGDQRILQDATCDLMHQKRFAHDPRVNGMGYGFMVSQQNGQTIAWHTGGSAHFNTMLALIPEENLGFFISYNTPIADLYQPLVSFVDTFYPAPAASTQPLTDTATRIATLSGNYVSSRVAHHSAQKLAGWLSEALVVTPGANNTLQVGSRTYTEVEPALFHQVDGPRVLTYRANAQGEVTHLFFGQFAYFKVPWYQTAGNQLLIAVIALLVMLTAGIAWAVDWLVRRRRGVAPAGRWATVARWTVVGLALLNSGLLAWFLVALLGFADSFVFPTQTATLITWLWAINIPALLAVVIFTAMAWANQYWRPAWRIHYTLVALAGVLFLGFLINWNLLPI